MQQDLFSSPPAVKRIGPFRTSIRCLSPEEIRRRNAEAGRTGTSAWGEDVEREIATLGEIQRSAPACGPAQTEAWATHPDERVRLALLGSALVRTDARREIGRLVMDADAADREPDEQWNPTIDKLALAPFETWPVKGDYVRRDNTLAYPPSEGPYSWVRQRVSPAMREMTLSTDQARELLSTFSFVEIVRLVLDDVRADRAFVEWLGEQHPDLVPHLAGRALGEDVDRALWDFALRTLSRRGAVGRPSDVIAILRRRAALPADAFAQLLDCAEQSSSVTWDFVRAVRDFLYQRGSDDVTAESLERLYRLVRRDKETVRLIVAHEAATPKLRAYIAQDTSFDTVRREIAQRYADTPDVRKVLGKSTSKRVLLRLAVDAEGDELIDVLDRLARKYPSDALNLLRSKLNKSRGILDEATARSMVERYFDRLVDVDPVRALAASHRIPHDLGEKELRVDWVRRIGRGLARTSPLRLNALGSDGLALLEKEDWEPLLTSDLKDEELVRLLRAIPSARTDREARRVVFERGKHGDVTAQLGTLEPGEERMAALAVLRACYWDFDTVFERHPGLAAALRTEDLLPLLEKGNSHIRQKAILVLGELRKREAAVDEPRAPERRDPSR